MKHDVYGVRVELKHSLLSYFMGSSGSGLGLGLELDK